MDWTSIYEEHGNEELVPPQEYLTHSRSSRLVSVAYYHRHHIFDTVTAGEVQEAEEALADVPVSYTLSSLYFLTINYILGVGCLGIPYAFAKSGIALGLVLVLLVTLLSYMTVMWVAEAGVRYEILVYGVEEHYKKASLGENKDEDPTIRTKNSRNNAQKQSQQEHQKTDRPSERTPFIHQPLQQQQHQQFPVNEYEVINLVSYFLGKKHQILYQASLMALMYIGLLAYSQVFVGSLSSVFSSSFENNTTICTIFFSLLAIPLSCMELDEQVAIQFIMALVRFLAIFIMIFGSVLGLLFFPNDNGDDDEDHESKQLQWINFHGFGVAFSTALFSQLFQHSVPGLVRPLQKENKAGVPTTFAYSLLTTSSFYVLLGITASLYFGNNTQPSVNINFNTIYHQSNILVQFATKMIVIFPALDTLSVFPLIANTLGNNLLAVCASTKTVLSIATWLHQWDPKNHSIVAQRGITIIFRVIASVPPLILSHFITDLSISMRLAGVAGLHVAFYAPALLQRSSCKMILDQEKIRGGDVMYTGWYSDVRLTVLVLIFATFSLVVVVYNFFE